MSRKKTADTVPFVRVGDAVIRTPVTFPEVDKYGRGRCGPMRGKVVYVHRRGRYHVVQFESGIREAFQGVLR